MGRWAPAGVVLRCGLLAAQDVAAWGDTGHQIVDARGPCADSLHAVWETCLIERGLGRDVRHIAAELRSRVTAAERAAWTGTGAKDWANESLLITTAETVRYGVRTEAGCWYEAENEVLDPDEATKVVTVDEAYLDTHLPIIEQRLTQNSASPRRTPAWVTS